MAIDLSALEQEIIERLRQSQTLPAEARIMAFPDRSAEVGSPVGKCAIVVRFSRLRLGANENSNQQAGFIQSGSIYLEIRLIVKDLRSHTGAYPLLSLIFDALIGWTPQQLGSSFSPTAPMSLESSELAGFGDGVWDWAATFSLPVLMRVKRHRST